MSMDDLSLQLPLSGVHLVEASAGTGKTFTLTAWVLRLVLEAGVPLPSLLAVTFTRTATAELRERIRQRLREAESLLQGAATTPRYEHTARLLQHVRARTDEALMRQRLQAALLQLDDAGVFTIHGFCQRALKEFGFLAGNLGEEELIDDARMAWSEVADDLWRIASHAGAQEFERFAALWNSPQKLARDLPDLCNPARVLLPKAQVSDAAAWLHDLRAHAQDRFTAALAQRGQRTQDQLIEGAWRASAQQTFAAALAQRWPVMLVDEFQDTDPRQWALFRNVFEARNRQAGNAGLFLIGDPKQAIYRFRGGDLPTYLAARNYAQEHGAVSTLGTNFRSAPNLLHGVETIFCLSKAPFVDPDIEFIHVEAAPRNAGMALRIDGQTRAGVNVHWVACSESHPSSNANAKRAAVHGTVNEIVRLLQAGELDDGNVKRRVKPSDIAVLVRSNKQGSDMRDALAAAGVAASLQSTASVFASAAAVELECLLHACAAPTDASLVLAALSTRLLGVDAHGILALRENALAMQEKLAQFGQAAQTSRDRGPLPALLPLLSAHSARLLGESGGARLLTDALHLLELLQAQSPMQHGIDGLLRWFQRQRSDDERGDALALRMESDSQAVQVMTLHKSKGLEFPLVFLPFSAFDSGRSDSGPLKKTAAHDVQGETALYVHAQTEHFVLQADDAEHARILRKENEDELAEDLRLFYVGLTRAKYAVYFSAGGTRTQDFNASPLRWLVYGANKAGGKQKPADMTLQARAQLEAVAVHCDGLRVLAVADDAPVPIWRDEIAAQGIPAPRFPQRKLERGAGQYSFSGLRSPHADVPPTRGAEDENAGLRGAEFGSAVHAVLETADFVQWQGREDAPPQERERVRAAVRQFDLDADKRAEPQVARLVARTLNAPLPGIGPLSRLPASRRAAEMEFHFRLGKMQLPQLFELLEAHGYPRHARPVRREAVHGLMHGYIDLVCRDDAGAFHVLDYKTNDLGGRYDREAMQAAIHINDYDLQYLIYLVALQRWLKLRLRAGYDAEKHLGGAIYLFLRGLQPGDAQSGVYVDRPVQVLIDALDALFEGEFP